MKNKVKVLVIYKGFSSEYKISLKTGNAVIEALKSINEFEVIPFQLESDNINEISKIEFDVAFIALHGKFGEDGTVQGYLDLLGKKYCGSGLLSSALCIDKEITKIMFKYYDINTPEHKIIRDISEIETIDFLPAVVKPVDEGSSMGLYIVDNKIDLYEKIEKVITVSGKVLVEKYVKGQEFTVPVIQIKKKNKVLPVIEIKPKNHFFDYEAKYVKGKTEYIVPAEIDKNLTERMQNLALKCFDVFQCKDFARIDFMKDENNNIYVLELNSIPGLTETSLLPMSAKAAGYDFNILIKNFIYNNL